MLIHDTKILTYIIYKLILHYKTKKIVNEIPVCNSKYELYFNYDSTENMCTKHIDIDFRTNTNYSLQFTYLKLSINELSNFSFSEQLVKFEF